MGSFYPVGPVPRRFPTSPPENRDAGPEPLHRQRHLLRVDRAAPVRRVVSRPQRARALQQGWRPPDAARPTGAALKQVISCTLLPPPVPAEKPKRNDAGSGPFDAVILWFVITGCAVPPFTLYERLSRPSCVILSA